LTVPALFATRFRRYSGSLLPLSRRHALPAVRRSRCISTCGCGAGRRLLWVARHVPRICVRYSRTTAHHVVFGCSVTCYDPGDTIRFDTP